MKKILFAVIGLVSIQSFAQSRSFGESFSLEAGYGYLMPMGTFEQGTATDYSDFKSLHIGAHYRIMDDVGVRFSYNYAEFQSEKAVHLGTTYHRLMLDATYDVYGAFTRIESPFKQNNRFEGLVHAGVGMSFSQPDIDKSVLDQGLGAQVGIQPKFYLTDNLSIFANVMYNFNTARSYSLEGIALPSSGTTSYVSGVLGVNYRFGQ